jgi:DNA sulfur modification protein DndD
MKEFEIQRLWREGVNEIEETLAIFQDGKEDDILTEHWNETIESYLPSGISHLFFFDGEQIKELAEGKHAAEILGTAVYSLLGLDIIDKLNADLKVFERRKKTEKIDSETSELLAQVQGELKMIDQEQEKLAIEEGKLVNEVGRLSKTLRELEKRFADEGGDIYLKRKKIEEELSDARFLKQSLENEYRELLGGPLPLLLVEDLLHKTEQQIRKESEILKTKAVLDVLEKRDRFLLKNLKRAKISEQIIEKIAAILGRDRFKRSDVASEKILVGADEELATRIAYLRTEVLPEAEQHGELIINDIEFIEEKIARLEDTIERIPTEEHISIIQKELERARSNHSTKVLKMNEIRSRIEILKRQKLNTLGKLDKLIEKNVKLNIKAEDRIRILKHIRKTQKTLNVFRESVIKKHASKLETLIFESFQKLLRKENLVENLSINPNTFQVTLWGCDGNELPFDRLSAGERQILATSLLWGLARACDRPVPTIIDTPLGRLDSSHRRHLIERYFPNASHQVILLSTDEEIVNSYYNDLEPYISRSYTLIHNRNKRSTKIKKGYFDRHDTTDRSNKDK